MPLDLWPHQQDGLAFAEPKEASMIGAGPGTGKTAVACHLASRWGCKRVLVICPPSVRSVWRRMVPLHSPTAFATCILDYGSVAKRTTQAADALRCAAPTYIVANTEAARREPLARLLLSVRWDAVILDESHLGGIKRDQTHASLFVAQLTPRSAHRLCLTGTPLAHSPLDAFGQYRFLDPTILGTDYVRFLATFAAPKQMRLRKKLRTSHDAVRDAIRDCYGPDSPLLDAWGEPPDWSAQLPGIRNPEAFRAAIAPITWICKSADVLDLPPLLHEFRDVELCPVARRLYDQLEAEAWGEIDGQTVTINSYLTLIVRLQQITSGYIPTPDGRFRAVDNGKRDALRDLLAETRGERAVVFCRFVHDLDAVQGAAAELGLRYAELSHRRKDAVDNCAVLSQDVEVAAVQPKSGGVGIDLSPARVGVWYSLASSLAEWDQGVARLHRPGTTGTRLYSLVVPDSIDADIHSAIADRRQVINAIVNRLKRRPQLCRT